MIHAMIATATKLTQADHGRRMSLDEFWDIETEEGLRVELAKGVIEVSEFPSIEQSNLEDHLREIISHYRFKYPAKFIKVMGPLSSKIGVPYANSERHPDLSLYLTAPPPGQQPWREWIPEIVIEIVSESSRQRDYIAKVSDYWLAGVKEYWIIDPQEQQIQLCVRGQTEWQMHIRRGQQMITTDLLPDFAAAASLVLTGGK